MLCYVMLCYIILYYVMLCYVMLYYIILYYIILYYIILLIKCIILQCFSSKMLLCATPILSYRSSDWFRSEKGRVCYQRQSLESAPIDASVITVAVVAVRWDTHRRVCLGCAWFPRVQISGTREYTARFLTRSLVRDLTAALWHAVRLRCCGICVL